VVASDWERSSPTVVSRILVCLADAFGLAVSASGAKMRLFARTNVQLADSVVAASLIA
jgi:hypothetical protein